MDTPGAATRRPLAAVQSVRAARGPLRVHAGATPFPSLTPQVRVALLGGQRLLRDATASLLSAQEGLRVLGTFDTPAPLLSLARAKRLDVVLVDCDGFANGDLGVALEELSVGVPRSTIALLCRELRTELVRTAVDNQVGGLILKSYSTPEVRAALEYVASGRSVMPAGWQRALRERAGRELSLSRRHREILALIAAGRSNKQIATELGLSANTVKFHVRVLYSRLGVHNRVEAASRYTEIAGDA
jgi:two-component system NarL family response regulator